MFAHGWVVWHLFLGVPLTLCGFEATDTLGEVTCSEGLWDCALRDGAHSDENSFRVADLRARGDLCCAGGPCSPCLWVEVSVDLDQPIGGEDGNSGQRDDGGAEETKDREEETGSVTVCYGTPQDGSSCRKVEFTVNQGRNTQRSAAQISIQITDAIISYSSHVNLHSPTESVLFTVVMPSLTDVCSSHRNAVNVPECKVPSLSVRMNEANEVELHFSDNATSACLQNEIDGTCQSWDGKPIGPESAVPCTCIQAWTPGSIARFQTCPFRNNASLWKNIRKNLKLSVDERDSDDNSSMLWWNVSAPCRFQGEVWACDRIPGTPVCSERPAFRTKMKTELWTQNRKGLWEYVDAFSPINLDKHPCVMINIRDLGNELGPFCFHNNNRWRWSLFAVAVMLLLSVTLLITLCCQNFIKKSVRSWCHGGFVRVPKARLLLLSPPDSDVKVCEAVCSLGSSLSSKGFCMTVDQWRRQGQLSMGPLPWSYGQLLNMDVQFDRIVLVVTPKAVEWALTWNSADTPIVGLQEEHPYSDVFRASLFFLQALKNQDRARECFVLVTFDSLWPNAQIRHKKLPQIFCGLPLFHFPSQTKALLADLCAGRTLRHWDRHRWTRTLRGTKNTNRNTLWEDVKV